MADTLKNDYTDDVLDTSANTLRKYQMIQNDDGTVSFVDVTEYSQIGDSFGAADVNAIAEKVNDLNTKINGLHSDLHEITTGVAEIVHSDVSGQIIFFIKNNICYLTGEFYIKQNLNGMTIIANKLPAPRTFLYFNGGGECGVSVPFAINTNAELSVYYPDNSVSTVQRYDICISYPIAE